MHRCLMRETFLDFRNMQQISLYAIPLWLSEMQGKKKYFLLNVIYIFMCHFAIDVNLKET